MRAYRVESRIASAMKTSAPMIVRSDHVIRRSGSTDVDFITHWRSERIGPGSKFGLNSSAFINAPYPIQPAVPTWRAPSAAVCSPVRGEGVGDAADGLAEVAADGVEFFEFFIGIEK